MLRTRHARLVTLRRRLPPAPSRRWLVSLGRAWAASTFALCGAGAASAAEVKDHEVIRYLYLKTSCGRATIVKTERMEGKIRFHADCLDKTSFPDGAVVQCEDPEDDRSCALATAPTTFENLRLLESGR